MKQSVKTMLTQAGWIVAGLSMLYGLAALGTLLDSRHANGSRLKVVLFINGALGDKSFFDSAARGLHQAARDMPVFTKVVEGGTDPTRWEGALTDLADSGDYDLIVVGTFTMVPYVEKIAAAFPDAHFVVFDAAVNYQACGCRNVYSVLFRQNEGAYLAGYLAASLDKQGLPGLPAGGGLGVIGGMKFPVIEDFVIGFNAGAEAAVPGVAVLGQYANSFSDPAAGKEIAKAQYAKGVSVIFHAAGATGQGVNEAAVEAHRYAIGVDMDQYALYKASNPERASRIVTSVVKNVDVAILRAISLQLDGRLAFGRAESLGVAEGGVSLARHSDVLERAPASVLRKLDEVEAAVAQQRLRIPGAFAAPSAH